MQEMYDETFDFEEETEDYDTIEVLNYIEEIENLLYQIKQIIGGKNE